MILLLLMRSIANVTEVTPEPAPRHGSPVDAHKLQKPLAKGNEFSPPGAGFSAFVSDILAKSLAIEAALELRPGHEQFCRPTVRAVARLPGQSPSSHEGLGRWRRIDPSMCSSWLPVAS